MSPWASVSVKSRQALRVAVEVVEEVVEPWPPGLAAVVDVVVAVEEPLEQDASARAVTTADEAKTIRNAPRRRVDGRVVMLMDVGCPETVGGPVPSLLKSLAWPSPDTPTRSQFRWWP